MWSSDDIYKCGRVLDKKLYSDDGLDFRMVAGFCLYNSDDDEKHHAGCVPGSSRSPQHVRGCFFRWLSENGHSNISCLPVLEIDVVDSA